MSESNESEQFLNRDDPDDLVEEVPSQLPTTNYERVPSGYDPMGEIHLRGRAASGFASGRIPWWVLITGWLIFGSAALGMTITGIYVIINGVYLGAIFPLVIGLALFSILWRGTAAKLRKNNRRRRRR